MKQTKLLQQFNLKAPSLAAAAWCDTEVGSAGRLNSLLSVYNNRVVLLYTELYTTLYTTKA